MAGSAAALTGAASRSAASGRKRVWLTTVALLLAMATALPSHNNGAGLLGTQAASEVVSPPLGLARAEPPLTSGRRTRSGVGILD